MAAADVGSNTVHVLVAETDGQSITRIDNESTWISLGEEVARVGEISDERAAELVSILQDYKKLAKSHGARHMYVFATEAMREAANHEAVLERIRVQTDLEVELISPRRETELSLEGVLLDSPADLDFLIEIGGGSAQVAHVSGGKVSVSASLLLGTGRLIAEAKLEHPCPPERISVANELIQSRLDELRGLDSDGPKLAVASGGVARGLWRALHPDGEPMLYRQEFDYVAWAAGYLPISHIAARFCVKEKRAATLLPGALVYGSLMDRLEITDLHVSMYGVREGAILEIVRGAVKPCPV